MADLKNLTINDTGFLKLPAGTEAQRPGGAAGDTRFNTDTGQIETYDGSTWKPQIKDGRTAATAAHNASEIIQHRDLTTPTQVWIDPLQEGSASAFQIYATTQLSDLGTIPSGGPSWVYDIRGINMLSRSIFGQTDTMTMSYAEHNKLVKSMMKPDGDYNNQRTPFFYWAVFQNTATDNLIGITRTAFAKTTYEEWRLHHTGDYAPRPTKLEPQWWVWGTQYLPSGTPYTIDFDEENHVRSIPYAASTAIIGGSYSTSNYGLHYKRTGSGEHYPWRNTSRQNNSEGYFFPSSTNGFYGLGANIVHYIFISDT